MNHIELFAGCGGLCLGLSSVGFKLVMANELSPMAAETFAFNILNEDLQAKSQLSKHSLWISSQFSREDMKKRLREDPRSYPSDLTVNSDLHGNGDNLQGSLVVGNILALNEWLNAHPIARAKLASALVKEKSISFLVDHLVNRLVWLDLERKIMKKILFHGRLLSLQL